MVLVKSTYTEWLLIAMFVCFILCAVAFLISSRVSKLTNKLIIKLNDGRVRHLSDIRTMNSLVLTCNNAIKNRSITSIELSLMAKGFVLGQDWIDISDSEKKTVSSH